jgi:NADH-quinone oxidoreductase subunit A
MQNFLLTPPIAFVILLAAAIGISRLLSVLSFKGKDRPQGAGTSYACGEDTYSPYVQPEYGQFFPFAFFFTILHVITLMIATVPMQTLRTFAMAVFYIAGAIIGLFILFRRDQ